MTVVLLGIDGLDPLVIEEHLDQLPALSRLHAAGLVSRLESIFPPDSIPAWITIFTGQAPAEHGVLESIDYLAKNKAAAFDAAPELLRGRTFWDELSRRGYRVAVLNPFMAYPAWDVNGVMVSGPVFVDESEPSVTPSGAELGPLPQLGGVVDFPNPKTMKAFLESSVETTREQVDFALRVLEKEQPDFLFLNILTIDRIQHFVWRFADPDDPTYPGKSDLSNGIVAAYKAIDDCIDRFTTALGPAGTLMALSDHGHGRRCTRMVYVDELLRRAGLVATGNVTSRLRTLLLERAKRVGLAIAYRFELEPQAYALARRIPGRKALKNSSYAVSGSQSLARVSRAFGRNSSGGIEIRAGLPEAERNRVRAAVIDLMRDLLDPVSGTRVCRWVKSREDVVDGEFAERFPDVLFELEEEYGVDFGVFGPTFADDTMHRRISGGHRRAGVYLSTRDLGLQPRVLTDVFGCVVAAVDVRT
jgi:predicted AlkP superfamily phosphohydrolase/phosphomutase